MSVRKKEKIELNGAWQLSSTDGKYSCVADIPSCNYLDLFFAGIINDPVLENNEETLQWISKLTWQYSREFTLTPDVLNQEKIVLVFEQLDTLASIYINGVKIGETSSVHVTYEFDIKKFVHIGINDINVVFSPPFEEIKRLQNSCHLPKLVFGETGNPHLRYPQYHFGWDWGPHFVSCGITRNVYIVAFSNRLTDIQIKQEHNATDVVVNMAVSLEADNPNVRVEGEILSPDNEILSVVFINGKARAVISNPKLWWCNGLGNQPLYKITVRLFDGDEQIDEISRTIGLRTIKLSLKKDNGEDDFCFVLNGQRIFARGSNWIPTDIFINRTTNETLDFLVKSAQKANMNMLRVWGGGYFERDEFYDLCDKYGILVWQDLMFACTPFEWGRKDFYENTILELESNVKRLRHRASLAFWCGNNEIESLSLAWRKFLSSLVKDMNNYFYSDIPDRLKVLDESTPYWQTSPGSGTFMKDMNSDKIGDTHIWGVWHGLKNPDYYTKRKTLFCSEFGVQSMPSLNAIDIFSRKSGSDLASHTMRLHQKCMSGNAKMKYYINKMYWTPKEKDHFVYLSQIVQAECMETATVGWRLMHEKCNGALVWQFNDCWGVSSWSAIDYYNNYKALQYRSRHFNAPVAVFSKKSRKGITITGINNTLHDSEISVRLITGRVNEQKYTEISKKILIPKDMTIDLSSILPSKNTFCANSYLLVIVSDEKGQEIFRKGILPSKKAKRSLLENGVESTVRKVGDEAIITLKTSVYKRFIDVRIAGENAPFSDNFIDMYPGEEKEISIITSLSEKEIKERLSITSVAEIKPKHSRICDLFSMLTVFLRPLNFLSYLYYTLT